MLVTNIRRIGLQSLTYNNEKNFGASIKFLKMKIKAVTSIQKITKAMKMVSTAKMKHEITRLNNGKDFAVNVVPSILANDTYMQRKAESNQPNKRILWVPMSTDKGLCGGINSQIVRGIRQELLDNRENCVLLPIGDKAASGMSRMFTDIMTNAVTNVGTPMNFYTASAVANYVANYDKSCDTIR